MVATEALTLEPVLGSEPSSGRLFNRRFCRLQLRGLLPTGVGREGPGLRAGDFLSFLTSIGKRELGDISRASGSREGTEWTQG